MKTCFKVVSAVAVKHKVLCKYRNLEIHLNFIVWSLGKSTIYYDKECNASTRCRNYTLGPVEIVVHDHNAPNVVTLRNRNL